MTDLALSQPTLARYRALPRALAIAAITIALFAFSYGASVIVLNPGSGGIKAAVLLYGFLLAPPAVFFLATWVWAIADALTYRIEAWETSGQLRFLWIGLIVFVWPIGAVVWLAAIRPQLVRSERAYQAAFV